MISLDDARGGGLVSLLEEALPAVAASVAIFANAPAGTSAVTLTVRGGTLSLRFGSLAGSPPVLTPGTATATSGHDYGAGTYDIVNNQDALKNVRAIGAAVTSGWITYWRAL